MRKRIFGKKLSRSRTARTALYRSLVRALVEHGKIETTQIKAKQIQRRTEKLVSLAGRGTLTARRKLLAEFANERQVVKGIFEIATQSKRKSGFTRIIPLPTRRGDRAKMARLEWVDRFEKPEEKKVKEQKKAKGKKTTKKTETKEGKKKSSKEKTKK